MALVHLSTIENLSPQVIPVIYQQGVASAAAGDVAYAKTGQLMIAPGSKIKIETNRLDHGQVETLKKRNLVKVTESSVEV